MGSNLTLNSLQSHLIGILTTQNDLLYLLLVTKRMAVHVSFKTDLNPIHHIVVLVLIKYRSAKVTYAANRLWKDYPIELHVVAPLDIFIPAIGRGCVGLPGMRLHDALVSHVALFHEAVREWLRRDNLSLRSFL